VRSMAYLCNEISQCDIQNSRAACVPSTTICVERRSIAWCLSNANTTPGVSGHVDVAICEQSSAVIKQQLMPENRVRRYDEPSLSS
jgi:hypothetical protein